MVKRKAIVDAGEVPKWVHDYFERAYESHTLLTRVVAISRKGIDGVTAMPRLSKAVARISGKERTPEELAVLEEEAALASSEVEKEFPVLHSLAVTGLWSWLEHFVKGIAIEWLLHHKKALGLPCFQRVKVRVGEYGTLSKREQAVYLVDAMEQEVSAALKHGVNRFEAIFESLEIAGKVKQSTADSIYELQQVRNVVAHRNGVTDRRLKAACPKLKLKIGEPIRISSRQFQSYSAATADYALTVLFRLGDRHGVDLRTAADDT